MMTINELMLCLEMGLIYGIVAIGIYITFRLIDFPDLTCDGSFVLGAAISSMVIKASISPWLALLLSIVGGGCAGWLTGILYTRFRITNLLSGILVAFMLYSVNLHVMRNVPNIALIGLSTVFSYIPSLLVLSIMSLVLVGLLGYAFYTDFGLALRSIGQNKTLAQNCGVSISTMTLAGLIVSNGLVALGGAFFSQHQGFADIGSGVGTVIIGLASVMIGENLFPSRSLWVQLMSCVMGSILYRILIGFALHSEVFGLETQDLNLITGLLVVVIMILPRKKPC